jgi:signal transduction histidine kinase
MNMELKIEQLERELLAYKNIADRLGDYTHQIAKLNHRIKEMSQKEKTIYDTLDAAVIVVDENVEVIYKNNTAVELELEFNKSDKYLFGRLLYDIYYNTYIRQGNKEFEIETKEKTKKVRHWLVQIKELYENESSIYYGQQVIILTEITNYRVLIERLAKTNDMLSRAQSKLVEKERQEGIISLAAQLAHEVNTPLGYINSNIETLKEYSDIMKSGIYRFVNSELTEEQIKIKKWLERESFKDIAEDCPELLQDTLDGIDQISKIVKALKNYSFIDFKKEIRPYDINKEIQNMMNLFETSFSHNGNLTWDLDDNIKRKEVRSTYWNQSLFDNIKYMAMICREIREYNLNIKTYQNDLGLGYGFILKLENSFCQFEEEELEKTKIMIDEKLHGKMEIYVREHEMRINVNAPY